MFNTVLTAICNPNTPIVDSVLLDAIRSWLPSASCNSAWDILGDGVAADLQFEAEQDLRSLRHAAAQAFAGQGVDIVIQPTASRGKKLLIADMDSTIIEQECIDELAEFAGKRAEISDITERAMRGALNFEEALKERVAMLAGLPEGVLAETFDNRISLTPGARTLVQTMNKRGAVTALVSGGFSFFTGCVAAETGFAYTQANELIIENGALTGAVRTPILGRAAKQNALLRLAGENNIALEETLAVGDGANDLSMLERAGLGVAYHAKPAVAEAAHARIDHGDLTALLYLQGVKQAEFVLNQ